MEDQRALQSLSDGELLRRVSDLVGRSRRNEAEIVAHIAEVDARRLYLRKACSSMFAYCMEVLHFSEAEAFLRIAAGRASREHPVLLPMLADGRLHLSAIARLAAHLTAANRDAVLARAVHKSKRQVEELVAELAPRPDAPALIRKLPERTAVRGAAPAQAFRAAGSAGSSNEATTAALPTAAAVLATEPAAGQLVPDRVGGADAFGRLLVPDGVAGDIAQLVPDRVASTRSAAVASNAPGSLEPTAPGRYKVQFTASADLRDKLERLQALMRDCASGGDLAAVIEDAVTDKLARLEARRFGTTKRPPTDPGKARSNGERSGSRQSATGAMKGGPAASARKGSPQRASRHIPAAIRRAVFQRDGGRCCFTDAQGRRCGSRERLEYHHRYPWAYGGGHSVDSVSLMCGAHHRLMTEADFGTAASRCRPAQRATSTSP